MWNQKYNGWKIVRGIVVVQNPTQNTYREARGFVATSKENDILQDRSLGYLKRRIDDDKIQQDLETIARAFGRKAVGHFGADGVGR